MNVFQQKLLSLTNSMKKASDRVCESEIVSQLDVDVLRQRLREMYDFLLVADYEEEIVETACVREPILEIETKVEETIEEKEPVKEEVEVVEEKVEEEKPIIEEEIKEEEKEEIIEIAQEEVEIEEEILNIEEELPKVVEPEIEFEEPTPEPEPLQAKSGSVLDYLHNNIMKDNETKQVKKEEYTTLDLFKTQPSIAEKFENKNRSDLRTAIGVGEKFMFINDLFSGDLKAYTSFINILNEASSLEMSMIVIEENRNKRKWIKNSLAYSTLENLVEKRFRK